MIDNVLNKPEEKKYMNISHKFEVIFFTILVLADIVIHTKEWDKFFADDPMGRPH